MPTSYYDAFRKGKDVPVIKKALVELEGQMFKAYAAVREKWGYLDCFRSPGPIQFSGPSSD
jgi:pyrophosphate--fructose-6-phosphate 1-phosphotransferase